VHLRGRITADEERWHGIYLQYARIQMRTQVQVDESRFKHRNTEALDRLSDLIAEHKLKDVSVVG